MSQLRERGYAAKLTPIRPSQRGRKARLRVLRLHGMVEFNPLKQERGADVFSLSKSQSHLEFLGSDVSSGINTPTCLTQISTSWQNLSHKELPAETPYPGNTQD